MSIPPKLVYRYNAIPIKIPSAFFTEMNKLIPKFTWNFKEPKIEKKESQKRTKLEDSLSDFKPYFKEIV